jgi:hypothetical protein
MQNGKNRAYYQTAEYRLFLGGIELVIAHKRILATRFEGGQAENGG